MATNRFQAPDDATMQAIKARGMPQSNRAPGPLGWPALSMASGAVTPAFQSGPMQPRAAVESFDLGGGGAPSRSMVTGDRSLTRNPNGRAGLPLSPMGEQIGSRGMTDQRRSEMAGRRLSSAMRAGDMRATELLYRGPNSYGRGFGPPQGFGPPPRSVPMGPPLQPSSTIVNNGQPPPTAPLMPPPMSTEQALGMPGFGAPAADDNQPPPMPSNLPWQSQPLPGMPMGALPPSTFNGGAGLPAPAPFSVQSAGGWDAFTQTMPDGSTKVLNARPTPEAQPTPLSASEMGRIRAAGFAPAEVGGRGFDAQGVPYLQPIPQPVPTEKVTEGPNGTTRTFTQPRGAAPTAAPTTAQDRVNKLMEKAGIKPTASTQTGQMPNANYAAPLRPEQMLEEARNEYARTGNDTALKQYFAQYPSEAVRLNQQEQQIWGQVAGQVDRLGRAAGNRGDAQDARNAYIDRFAATPFTQGAISAEFAQLYPGAMNAINGSLPMPDVNLIGNANDLSRRAAAAAGRTMPAMPQRAPLQPMPPPLPMMIAERNPQGFVARLNQLPTLPAFMRPTIRR